MTTYAEETHLPLPAQPLGASQDLALAVASRPGRDYCVRQVPQS